jgi:hypothetical protein
MDPRSPDNLVEPQDGCPVCSERRVDCLVWVDDERVACSMCGTVYTPQATEPD